MAPWVAAVSQWGVAVGNTAQRVALFAPDWPPERFANGIVTYAGIMRGALGDLGVEMLVVSSDVAVEDRAEFVFDLVDWRQFGPAELMFQRVQRRIDAKATAMRRARRSLGACLRHLATSRPIDLFEIEESFGLGSTALECIGFPTVARLHGPWFLNGRALGEVENAAFRRRDEREGRFIAQAHGVSSPSRDVLEQTREHFQLDLPHAQVIPNPAPETSRVWDPRSCEPDTILFVGRFDRHKGGDLAIDAFREVSKVRPNARLLFVGPDRGLVSPGGGCIGLPEYIQQQLPDPATRDRVEVFGHLDRQAIETLRTRAAVTIVPSRYEVAAMTVLEAMAAGSPLIVAEAGGLSELPERDRSGLLFQPGDVDALSRNVLSLLADPNRAAELGAEARRRCAQAFSPAVVAQQSRALYDDVVARFHRDGGDSDGRRAK